MLHVPVAKLPANLPYNVPASSDDGTVSLHSSYQKSFPVPLAGWVLRGGHVMLD
jgi:hypothetical protein